MNNDIISYVKDLNFKYIHLGDSCVFFCYGNVCPVVCVTEFNIDCSVFTIVGRPIDIF